MREARVFFTFTAALAALAQAPRALAQSEAESAQDAQALPEVVVSGDQGAPRPERPEGSASVADRAQLEDAQAVSTLDLTRVFPDLLIADSGTQLLPMVMLRGLAYTQDFYNPALAVYVDGVPQLPVFTVQSLVDVESIELLKGPQATLYGKTARAGVLDIATHQPGDATEAAVRAGISSRGGYQAQANLSGPLAPGLLYGAISLADSRTPGELHSPVLGSPLGDRRAPAGNFKLRLAPAGSPWEMGLTGARNCISDKQAYTRYNDINSHTAHALDNLPDAYRNTHERLCVNTLSTRAQYQTGRWQLSAVASTQRLDLQRQFAFDSQYLRQPEQWRQNTQELRLSTRPQDPQTRAGGDWDATLGLYRQQINQSRQYTADTIAPDVSPLLDTRSRNNSQTLAAYGDLTWYLTARADLSAGLRLSRDAAATRFAGALLGEPFSGSPSTRQNTTLGRIGAGYRFSPQWRGYVNIAQDYKPAGYTLAPDSAADAQGYARERSTTYETGARYSARNLVLGAAAYRVNTRGMQLYGSNPFGFETIQNMGDTRINGLEFNADWNTPSGWALHASGFITAMQYRRYTGPGDCGNCNGSPPARGLALGATGRVRMGGLLLRPRIAARFLGAHYFDTANTLRQGGYAVIDAGLAWNLSDVEITLYATNLADKVYRTYGFSYGSAGDFAKAGEGRTLGVTLTWAY